MSAAPRREPSAAGAVRHDATLLGEQDYHLFNEGNHVRLHDKLGAHAGAVDGKPGTFFGVWAPDAAQVAVMGDWNGWDRASHPLARRRASGVWEGFAPGVGAGALYKFHVVSRHGGYRVDKADPFATRCELPPQTASVVWPLAHEWKDAAWMSGRAKRPSLAEPLSIYEVHLGSWRRVPEEGDRPLTYRELAPRLADYAVEMGFTHVELLPVAEHPFYGSWGYQTTGFFAPTSRYGAPEDFMALVDHLHQRGIGVILDWTPAHFPTDEHGLGFFDGSHLFEHGDPRQGFHPDWRSFIFNYGRHEVRSFLLSNAISWLERYHVDGLRVDAVASMLYLDYSRREGEWIPNERGGRENLEAIAFLRRMNEVVAEHVPGALTIAEESTAWPMVTRPAHLGGLGFDLKWDMGWMHDSRAYLARDPVHRRFHHGELTFRALYAWNERFVLPLSHDEVVHGKGSLLSRMPGDEWQQRANLRLLLGWQFTQPGRKLLFMGGELGQRREWSHDRSLDWHLLDDPRHRGLQRFVRDLNTLYRGVTALHARDNEPAGFEWVDCNDADHSTIAFLRRGTAARDVVLVAFNFTPQPRHNHRLGVPFDGDWTEILNSDAPLYGGSGQGNFGGARATPVAAHGRPSSIVVTLPPLGLVAFRAPAPPSTPSRAGAE